MALINENEFFDKFFAGRKYGSADNWPSTTLLCCCFAEYKTESNGPLKHVILTRSEMGHIWMRFDNTVDNGVHAEKHMIGYLKESIQEFSENVYKILKVWVFVVLSKSPCKQCDRRLCKFKITLVNIPITPILRIRFANFYRCYQGGCLRGLYNMMKYNIRLDVFHGKDWQWLLQYVLGLSHTFDLADLSRTKLHERQNREDVDSCILRGLYYCKLHLKVFKEEELLAISKSKTPSKALTALKRLKGSPNDASDAPSDDSSDAPSDDSSDAHSDDSSDAPSDDSSDAPSDDSSDAPSDDSSDAPSESATSRECRETWRVSGREYTVPWPEPPMISLHPEK